METEYVRIFYKLNKNASISIKTAMGTTNSIYIPDIWKQGTIGGPLACCSVVDELPKMALKHSSVINVHNVKIPPVFC